MQAHTGREVAAIAWPDVEPRRIELIDLAGHGIELVEPYVRDVGSFVTVDEIAEPFVPGKVIQVDALDSSVGVVNLPLEPVEPTEPLHMTVPAELFAEQALAVPDVAAEPEVAVEVANDPPGMAG